jgi:hypothetical protein
MHFNIYPESFSLIEPSDVLRDIYTEPRVLWICPDFAWELLKLTLSVDDSSDNNQLRRAIDESQSSRSWNVYLVPPERAYHIDVVEGKGLLCYSLVAPAVIQ